MTVRRWRIAGILLVSRGFPGWFVAVSYWFLVGLLAVSCRLLVGLGVLSLECFALEC
jgi:hypothetical protein